MAVTYTRGFQHRDWIDNVHRVQAAGQDGFNVRFHGLEAEFDRLSDIIAAIDTALGTVLSAGGGDITGDLHVAGSLGVGTTTPLAKFDLVGGDLRFGNGSRLQVDQGGSLELGGDSATPGTGSPYIDFHFQGLIQDFNTRIINDADGRLSVVAAQAHVAGALQVEPGDLRIRNIPGDDSVDALSALALVGRAAGGGERTWSLYTAAVGGGFGVEPNAFEIWQYPEAVPRFKIRPNGDTLLAPSGGMTRSMGEFIFGNNARLTPDQGGSIELGGDSATPGAGVPYIDFHHSGLTQDFNTRIINDADGQLTIHGNVTVTGNIGSSGRSHVPATVGWQGGVHTFDVEAEGSLFCPNKNFRIDHPLDPDRWLVHGCLEGPESGVFYRGTARLTDGRATVALPHFFDALTRPTGRTVLLTPVATEDGPVSMLAASAVRNGEFRVRAIDGANPSQEFSWHVTAVRADIAELDVEPVKDRVPQEASVGV